jgi:hypothetical protein
VTGEHRSVSFVLGLSMGQGNGIRKLILPGERAPQPDGAVPE